MRSLFFLALFTLALAAGCDADAHRARLAGAWQRDFSFDGGKGRFLTLQLKSVTSDEFVGRDELGSRDVVYRRGDASRL